MTSWLSSCAMWSRAWIPAALLLTQVVTTLPAAAQEPGDLPPEQRALQAVQEVRRLLDEGNLGDALVKAAEATDLDPQLAAAWRARAVCHQMRGNDIEDDRELAIAYYTRSLQLEEWEQAHRQLRALAQEGRYPRWVTEATLDFLPGDYRRRVVSIRDERLAPEVRGELLMAISTEHQYPERVPRHHAVYGDRFAGVTYGFLEDPEDPAGRLRLVARVFYPTDTLSATGRDFRQEASRTAEILTRICAYYRAYLGTSLWERLARPVSFFLVEGPPAGSIEPRTDAAVYHAETTRTGAEWVGDVCAAFGTMAMPAVGPLPGTPMWASGTMGEALYPKWLLVNSIDGVAPWGEELVDMTEVLLPGAEEALQAFMAQPPNDESMVGPVGQEGQLCAGLALYAESILAGDGLEEFLVPGQQVAPRDLLWRFSQILGDREPGRLRVPGGLFVAPGSDPGRAFSLIAADAEPAIMLPGRPLRYRVYLDEAEWSLTLVARAASESDRATRINVLLTGGPRRDPAELVLELRGGRKIVSGVLPPMRAGWYIITLTHDNAGDTVELSSISLAERQQGIAP